MTRHSEIVPVTFSGIDPGISVAIGLAQWGYCPTVMANMLALPRPPATTMPAV